MRRTASVGIIFFTVFMDLLGFGMVLPLMPLYAADPRFQASAAEIGWLMAIFSLMQFVFAPLWGRLSDRIGRRPVLLIGLFGSSFSYLLYGLAESYTLLLLARALAGIMGANIAVAQAALADLTTPEKRTKAMGLIGVAFGLGFILGPALGSLTSGQGLSAAPLLAALITAINGVAALFWLGESYPAAQRSSNNQRRGHPLWGAPWQEAKQLPGALHVCFLMGIFTTLFAAFEVIMPLWGQAQWQWTVQTVGWIFSYIGVVAVLVQGGIVRHLAAHWGEQKTAGLGLLLISAGIALFTQEQFSIVLAALAMIAAGSGLVHPGLSSLVSLNCSPQQQGLLLGLFQSMSALGRGVGPVVGGMVYQHWPYLFFMLIAVGLSLAWLWLLRMRHQLYDSTAPNADWQNGSTGASPTAP
ncbi:MFS transporter [Candidatus Magnetaquicoccus inordinatus]|uniref:MFS transporter n=1 Tax=Candidatus Magnetaquicoccus inordinatus TaxID=2496818 RepID=UPI00102B0373|nr:MFS transporter [Candidatus Magnetaquicoccus inordinatus]